jgi:hypothetical protein
MLYVLHCGNHPELSYKGGQGPIVHLEVDLYDAAAWADAAGHPWAFSLSNAGAVYTSFCNRLDELDKVNWAAVVATDFRSPEVKEGKQAEFLVHGFLPWTLVTRVGVRSMAIRNQAMAALTNATHQPHVEIVPAWYY